MVIRLTPQHFRMARAALQFELRAAQERLGISRQTLTKLEQHGNNVRYETELKAREAYEKDGIRFLDGGGVIGVIYDPVAVRAAVVSDAD